MISRICGHVVATAVGLLGWSATVMAATSSPDLMTLPFAQIGVGIILALWGGLTRTGDRALSARIDDRDFVTWAELGKDIILAAPAGFLTYLWGATHAWSEMELAGALFTAGYLGALMPAETIKAKLLQMRTREP